MELKKSRKADLERYKATFLLAGLVIAIGIVLLAFEWKAPPKGAKNLGESTVNYVDEELIPPVLKHEQKTPPPPSLVNIEIINITSEEITSTFDPNLLSSEATPGMNFDIPVFVRSPVKEEAVDDTQVFVQVEQMPEFPGGEAALIHFLATSVKYPQVAQENGIQGRVYVSFIVDTDGSVINTVIARGVDPSLDKEAIRVVAGMPGWKPGRQFGKPVKVAFTVPINFVLQ
jgi:periplasmic protein TonB